MFADTIAQNTRVTVVNPWPDLVVERLVDLGVSPNEVATVNGTDCVETYVNHLESELKPQVDITTASNIQLAVGTGGREHAIVGPIAATGQGIARLTVASIYSEAGRDPSLRTTLDDLLRLGDLNTIEIDYGDSHISTVAQRRVIPGPSGTPGIPSVDPDRHPTRPTVERQLEMVRHRERGGARSTEWMTGAVAGTGRMLLTVGLQDSDARPADLAFTALLLLWMRDCIQRARVLLPRGEFEHLRLPGVLPPPFLQLLVDARILDIGL
jgi:hypothetical protein